MVRTVEFDQVMSIEKLPYFDTASTCAVSGQLQLLTVGAGEPPTNATLESRLTGQTKWE